MSTLQCANIHFESTQNNRIQYAGSNNYVLVAGGSNAMSINTTAILFAPGGTTLLTVNSSGSYDTAGSLRSIPIISKSAVYELASADNGETISTTANVTVNGAVLSSGQVFTIFNNSAATITIVSGTGVTMYLGGTATTGNRTLAQRGLASILCVAANTFVISGVGLT